MATFLLEVGTEELPAGFIDEALSQWRSQIPESLAASFLSTETVTVYGTPRRLAVQITGLPTQQPDRTEEVKGPPAKAAFKDGKPTKAAEGFARSRGVTVDDLDVRETDKGDFIFVQQTIAGRPTAEILTELSPQWILGLEGKRFMRWGDGDLRFPRPIRWLVTLLDDQVLPLTLENGSEHTTSGRQSWGHRVLHPAPIDIAHATDYLTALQSIYVEVAPEARKAKIQTQVQAAAESVNGKALVSVDLLEEVVNLVEWPTAVVGQFDPEFLDIPDEVTIIEMEGHQRYFPVTKGDGSSKLLPHFITISNGDPAKSDVIAAGNGRVIRARLSDGKFFFDADRQQPLEAYLPRLETVTFQEKLGSVREKVSRLSQIADQIADQLQISDADRAQVQRTALLCKADLVTQMVGEFPELQGVMGQKYALSSGEPDTVADGIMEHYLPRGAGDDLPQSLMGRVVGLADRLDTLVGIFGIGLIPSGSSDPFALRRAANAVLNIIWDGNLQLNLHQLLHQVIGDFQARDLSNLQNDGEETGGSLQEQLLDFFLQRLRTLLQEEQNLDYDLVNAVLGEADLEYTQRALVNVLDTRDRVQFLQAIRNNGILDTIYETVNRSARLAAQGDLGTVQLDPAELIQPDLFQQSSEQAFYDALVQLVPQTQVAQKNRDYQTLIDGIEAITPIVSNFFDGPDSVLVMDPDADIRQNRLNLLGLLRNHARVLADFGAIVKQ